MRLFAQKLNLTPNQISQSKPTLTVMKLIIASYDKFETGLIQKAIKGYSSGNTGDPKGNCYFFDRKNASTDLFYRGVHWKPWSTINFPQHGHPNYGIPAGFYALDWQPDNHVELFEDISSDWVAIRYILSLSNSAPQMVSHSTGHPHPTSSPPKPVQPTANPATNLPYMIPCDINGKSLKEDDEITIPIGCNHEEGATPIDHWVICKHCGTNLRKVG